MVCMAYAGAFVNPTLLSAGSHRRLGACRSIYGNSPQFSRHARSQHSRRVSAQSTLTQPVAVQSLTQEDIPTGHQRYETMLVLRPDLTDEDRDVELAKFEAFLAKQGGSSVNAMVRGRQNLAYPIKKFWEGIYVLYEYAAPRKASPAVQKYLSTPIVGAEYNILRHMTFNR